MPRDRRRLVVPPAPLRALRPHRLLRSIPSQHGSKHAKTERHPIIRSFEPDEDWFYDYGQDEYAEGPDLAPPDHHPLNQPTPGPAGRVPRDWERLLH